MKQLALGRYIPYDTIIHRLDPRAKIIGLGALLIAIFLPMTAWGYGLLIAFTLLLLKLTKVKLVSVYRSLKPMWFMMLFLFVFNVLLVRSGEILFTIFGYSVYQNAIIQTISIFLRLSMMVSITTVLTASTKPLDLTYGLESLFSPLKVIRFPAHEIAMTISIALRFIPTLLEETEKIMKAQASRGVDLNEGKLNEKITAIVSLIIPLFISSFQRSEDLANAMEARGYNPSGKRTRYRLLKWANHDTGALIIVLLIAGITLLFGLYPNWLNEVLVWLV
ncbi:MAG: energy-coupling factor transporter transmembrane component T [Bacilli bacterium]|jgi:energy-coupling factor transport system permease protein